MKARAADGSLDGELVTYYNALFSALGDEELALLSAGSATLATEGVEALTAVLAVRNIAPPTLPGPAMQFRHLAGEHKEAFAEELARGQVAMSAQALAALAALTLAVMFLPELSFSAVPVGLLSLVIGFTGYWCSRSCIRKICDDQGEPAAQRRKQLRWFTVIAFVVYAVVAAAAMRHYIREWHATATFLHLQGGTHRADVAGK